MRPVRDVSRDVVWPWLALVFLQQMALGVPMQKLNIFETIMLDGLDLEY